MKGLSLKAVEAIERLIKSKFDTLSLDVLGIIPKQTKEKRIVFSTSKSSIISLFLRALNSKDPNRLEENSLKVLLRIASGYIDALSNRTVSRIINSIDAYIKNQDSKDESISGGKVKSLMDEEMDKAGNHLKLIINSESNKAINIGTALQIAKIADDKDDKDPTVFFIVTVDDVTGPEEFILHLLPNKKTPRVWKLSEIGSEYRKVGDPNPKFPGLHPNCRCKLTYLAKGWGFDASGRVKFISPDWDEYANQHKAA